ncbi:MAG: hypothetical protein AAB316_06115 [Bacteroidota bacterium]
MKKLFFLFAFVGLFAFCADAQKKACCAAKGVSADKVSCTAAASTDADKAASADASIVKQVSNTGEVSFARKETCPQTGKVSFTSVEYCTKTSKFVNVSPSQQAASCTKSATATKVSATTQKAGCCAAGANKACCKPGEKAAAKTTTVQTDAAPKAKMGSAEGGN